MNNTHKPPKGDDPVCELLPPEGNPPAPFPGTAVMAMATERFVAEVSRAISEIDAVKNGTANVTVK